MTAVELERYGAPRPWGPWCGTIVWPREQLREDRLELLDGPGLLRLDPRWYQAALRQKAA